MGPKKHPLQTERDQALDEASRRGVKVCACGVFIGPRAKRCRRCTCRLAQARYSATGKHKAHLARYRQSEKYKAKVVRGNEKRIFIGENYRGVAQTVEQAAAIKAHVKERTREFIARQQARAKAEGASLGAVSIETEA